MKWKDDIYYKYPICIPFMSTLYPPNVVLSVLTRWLPLNIGFRVYSYFILVHYLLGSFLAYFMFRQWAEPIASLFGSITLTYAGYCIKLQTPSFVYTASWLPGIFLGGWTSLLSTTFSLLGGYWPILVYIYPVILFLHPMEVLIGTLLALPQIISFLWYWKKSVRWGEKIDRNFGKVPWWKLKDLLIPTNNYNPTNGVHFPEMEMYMGIAPLFIFHWSWWWVVLATSILTILGVISPIQRIPSRALYLTTLSISSLSVLSLSNNLNNLTILTIVQMLVLLRNTSIYPSFPFSQWWGKPSLIYPKADITGYLKGERIGEYRGAFRLRD